MSVLLTKNKSRILKCTVCPVISRIDFTFWLFYLIWSCSTNQSPNKAALRRQTIQLGKTLK